MSLADNLIKKSNLCQVDMNDLQNKIKNLPQASSSVQNMKHDFMFLKGKAEAYREAAKLVKECTNG